MIKIIVTQCTDKDDWYKDKIGHELELSHEIASYYWVRYINEKGNKALNTVNIKDAKIIK